MTLIALSRIRGSRFRRIIGLLGDNGIKSWKLREVDLLIQIRGEIRENHLCGVLSAIHGLEIILIDAPGLEVAITVVEYKSET